MSIAVWKKLALTTFLVVGITSINNSALADDTSSDTSTSLENGLNKNISVTHAALIPDTKRAYASGTFTLTNDSISNRLLVNITSSACQEVIANHVGQTLEEMAEGEKNIFANLTIPHNSVIQFPRNGYHFVCHGFNNPQTQTVPFTFHFSEGDLTVPFKIKN